MEPSKPLITAADILEEMAATYRERNAVYGPVFETVGKVMEAMFPEGITIKGARAFEKYHQFDWNVGKMARFAATNLTHVDSIHDSGVYSAMVAAHLRNHEAKNEQE